jgi:NADP-dependent aldehyde dehydrogenase
VIVKAHNAHPGTGELVGQAVAKAVKDSNLPGGVFSLLFGAGRVVGQELVADPAIKAVGFTGSRSGGIALMKTAAARPEPIPVYAEMSSINPVFVLPGSIASDSTQLAKDFVASLTMGSGQYCTGPGLLFVPVGGAGDAFINASASAISGVSGQTMLTAAIAEACATGINALASTPGVEKAGAGVPGDTQNSPAPILFTTDAATFATSPELQEEVFGAAGLFVRFNSEAELHSVTESLQGQLTATVHATAEDSDSAARLIPVLERKVGRILFNSWPTGVEVNHAMVHGGPFPATSDSRSTSVGTLAINRFQRPVSYQNLPDELLPAPLQEANPWNLNRRINGTVVSK